MSRKGPGSRETILFALCCALLLPTRGLSAQQRTRLFLILCDALTLDDLFQKQPNGTAAYPHLAHLAENGALAMMNCVVPGAEKIPAATLALATGQQVPAEAGDADAANDWEAVPGERGGARAVYARRYGPLDPALGGQPFDPQRAVKHLDLVGLRRRGLDTARIGPLLSQARPPVRAAVFGNADTETRNRSAALLTLDAAGTGAGVVALRRTQTGSPYGLVDDPVTLAQYALESEADFIVVQMGDLTRVEASRDTAARADALRRVNVLVYLLTARLEQEGERADLLLVSPRPPASDAHLPNTWIRLTPLIAAGPHFPPGLLTSATTRTLGLVANSDLAPTVLSLFHVSPAPAMTGRPLRVVPYSSKGEERLAAVTRLDFVSLLNGQAVIAIFVPFGGLCFFLTLGSLAARRWGGMRWARRFAPALIFTQNLATALLLAPLQVPPTLVEYALRIAGWMAALTVGCTALARLGRVGPPVVASLLCIALVVGDALAGQPLVKNSLLSNYPLSGIRYYGIGNEYLGVLLGFALASGFAWLDDRAVPYPPAAAGRTLRGTLGALWLCLLLLLGWPELGANAGSLTAAGAGFGVGAALLRGKRATVGLGVACIVGGLLLAFAFGAVEAVLAGSEGSHMGKAIQVATASRGAGYLAEIALRKVGMNLRLLVSPWLLLSASVVAVTVWTAQALVGDAGRTMLRHRPWTRVGLVASLAALIAALIFKDSGVVVVTFMAGSECLILLYYTTTQETPDATANPSTGDPNASGPEGSSGRPLSAERGHEDAIKACPDQSKSIRKRK